MSSPMQITLRHMERSDALETRVRRLVQRLERLHSGILSSRIVIEAAHHLRHQGRAFVVRLEIKVPGDEIIVDRDHHEDPYVALRDAFEAAGRQVEDYARRRSVEKRRANRAAAETAG